MAHNDVASASQLKIALDAQRIAAHEAFVRLIEHAQSVSRACRPPRSLPKRGDR